MGVEFRKEYVLNALKATFGRITFADGAARSLWSLFAFLSWSALWSWRAWCAWWSSLPWAAVLSAIALWSLLTGVSWQTAWSPETSMFFSKDWMLPLHIRINAI